MSSPDPKEYAKQQARIVKYMHAKKREFCCSVETVGADAQRRSADEGEELGTPEIPGEQTPEPMRLAAISVGMTNDNFVPNADTVRTTFAMDPSNLGSSKARGAFGILIDTVGAYQWTRAGVTSKNMKGKYNNPVSDEARSRLGRKVDCVQACMEAIRLPRDVKASAFDDFVRFHFLPIMSNANKSEELDCVPMGLVFEYRGAVCESFERERKKQGLAADEVACFKMDMSENTNFTDWRENLPALLGEYVLQHDDLFNPEVSMGNYHVESVGNPRSEEWFSAIKDRECLTNTLPQEDKDVVLRMRQLVIDEANNPNSYLHRCAASDGGVVEVFRMPHMENCYPLPANLWGKMSLPSQNIGEQLTPMGLENDAPNHLVVRSKCFLKLHHRGSNKVYFDTLRSKLPLEKAVPQSPMFASATPAVLQKDDMFTQDGYRKLWIPSRVDKKKLCAVTEAGITKKNKLFDHIGTDHDQGICLRRLDNTTVSSDSRHDFLVAWKSFKEKVYRFNTEVRDDEEDYDSQLHVPVFLSELDEDGNEVGFVDFDENNQGTFKGKRVVLYAPDYLSWRTAANSMCGGYESATLAIGKFASLCVGSGFSPDGQVFWDTVKTTGNAGGSGSDSDASEDEGMDAAAGGVVCPIKLQRHYAIPSDRDALYKKSMKRINKYCTEQNLPVFHALCRGWEKPTFAAQIMSPKARCCMSRPCFRLHGTQPKKHLKDYAVKALYDTVAEISTGPDNTRSEKSQIMVHLKRNVRAFRSGDCGLVWLEGLGSDWVSRVILNPDSEFRVKNALVPAFHGFFELDHNNDYVLRKEIEFPNFIREDPDHRLTDVMQAHRHFIFHKVGHIFSGYKYGNLIYYAYMTGLVVVGSSELMKKGSPAVVVIFLGERASGKSTLGKHLLCFYHRGRNVICVEQNSATNGLGVLKCFEENRISYADEMVIPTDPKECQQQKERRDQGFGQRTRNTPAIDAKGRSTYEQVQQCNRRIVAEVGNCNVLGEGNEDHRANMDRALVIKARARKISYAKEKMLFGAKVRDLQDAMNADTLESSGAQFYSSKFMSREVNHTERVSMTLAWLASLPKEAGVEIHMDLAISVWSELTKFLTELGCVVDERPRLKDSMKKIERVAVVEHAIVNCFEAARNAKGEQIEWNPKNWWRVVTQLHSRMRTACNTYFYCSSEILRINHEFTYMDALFSAMCKNTHVSASNSPVAMEIRDQYMEENPASTAEYMVTVWKLRANTTNPGVSCPEYLKKKWKSELANRHQEQKELSFMNGLWKELSGVMVCSYNWRFRARTSAENEGVGMPLNQIPDAHLKFPIASRDIAASENCLHKLLPVILEPNGHTNRSVKNAVKMDTVTRQINGKDQPFAVVMVHWGALRHAITQRKKQLECSVDVADSTMPAENVARAFENVEKNLMKQAFQHVMSYKHSSNDPFRRAKVAQIQADAPLSAPCTGLKTFRQTVPGRRHLVCRDDGNLQPEDYVVSTIADDPKWHQGASLAQYLCDTIVSKENPNRNMTLKASVGEDSVMGSGGGEDFLRQQKEDHVRGGVPVQREADIWANYEVFLALAHPNGFLRGTQFEYDPSASAAAKWEAYEVYCEEFQPSSVAVLNLPTTGEYCGHNPQNQITEYINESRKRGGGIFAQAEAGLDLDVGMGDDDDDDDEGGSEEDDDDEDDDEEDTEEDKDDDDEGDSEEDDGASHSKKRKGSSRFKGKKKKKRKKKGVARFVESGASCNDEDDENDEEMEERQSDRDFLTGSDGIGELSESDSLDLLAQYAQANNSSAFDR